MIFSGCKCGKKPEIPAVAQVPMKAAPPVTSTGAIATAASPATTQPKNLLGNGISVALDAAGHPAVAFGSFDLNGDDEYSDSVIAFSAWDEATKAFKAPVTVDRPGDVRKRNLELAIDGSTIAIAYPKLDSAEQTHGIWLASSTDGKTFTPALVSTPGARSAFGWSALALRGGVAHLAWNEGDDVRYRTGPVGALSESVKLAIPEGYEVSSAGRLSLALDAKGVPAVVFGVVSNGQLSYAWWRPGFEVAKILAATGKQNDDWAVALAFSGTTARVAMLAAFASVPGEGVKVSSSADGASWSAPLEVPNDGGQLPNLRLAFAVSPGGKSALSYGVAGGNLTGTKCGEPKVARAQSFDAWTVCSPTTDPLDTDYPSLTFTADDKLVLAFQNTHAGPLPAGVLVYVEP